MKAATIQPAVAGNSSSGINHRVLQPHQALLGAAKRASAALATLVLPFAFWSLSAVQASGQAATVTTLDVFPSNAVALGTTVELLATVQSGGSNLPFGVVTFCDANAPSCTGSAMLGQVEVTNNPAAGTAALFTRLGIGNHSIKAVFSPQRNYAKSVSTTQAITVTGSHTTNMSLTSSGSPGAYSLTAKVTSIGRAAAVGPISFLDSSDSNFSLGTAQLAKTGTSSTSTNLNLLTAGAGPVNMAVGDFNLDGIPDLVVVDFLTNAVQVLYGDGHGGVSNTGSTQVSNAWSVAVGDFNGDGIPDIAVADSFSRVHILEVNLSDLSMSEVSSQDTGNGEGYIAVGDFNNDGVLDLAITTDGAKLDFLAGTGFGTFDPPKYFVLPGSPGSIAMADFNGDGNLDVVLGLSFDPPVVMLGDGNGNFTAVPANTFGNEPTSVAVLDINRDGIPDVVTIDPLENIVYTFTGNGDGTMTPLQGYETGLTKAPTNASLVVTDLNGDGFQDVAYITSSDGGPVSAGDGTVSKVTFLKGTATGFLANGASLSTGSDPLAIVAGDWNGDGYMDLAVANEGSGTVQLYNAHAYVFSTATLTPVSIPGGGTHNVFASFGGSTGQKASKSATIALTGTPIPTTTTLNVSPGLTVVKGTTVQLTATVTPNKPSNLVDNSSVKFLDGTTVLGTVNVTSGAGTVLNNQPGSRQPLRDRCIHGEHQLRHQHVGSFDDYGHGSRCRDSYLYSNARNLYRRAERQDRGYDGRCGHLLHD